MRILVDLQGAQTESRFRGIGRYSLSLALAMARNVGEHEIWLTVSAAFPESVLTIRHAFEGLIPQEHIRVFEVPTPIAEVNSANAWRARAAEKIREHFLQQLKPDVVHVSSLFEGYIDDAVTSVGAFTLGINTAVTLYDLIPLLDQETYLPTDTQRDYYFRKVQSLKNARLLLAISESSRCEAINALQLAEDRIVNISSAIDDSFHPIALSEVRTQQLRRCYGIQRKMVMSAPGGFDQRKNLDGLIDAYALLPSELRASHQLVIVSKISDGDRANLQRLRKQAGLAEDELVLTGYVSDDDLVSLYNLATLFVFPSKYEGFGLPALEAMACGTPTIGSNGSSVPEVIGWDDALFDPASEQSIANKMAQVLTDGGLRGQLRKHGLQQAKSFSWMASAKRAISVFESQQPSRSTNKCESSDTADRSGLTPLLESLAEITTSLKASDSDLLAVARAIAFNTSGDISGQLLIDISELIQRDAKTGIQRVTRSILRELLVHPPDGYRIEPVYATTDRPGYRYARRFTQQFLGQLPDDKEDEPIETQPGDIFLGLDLQAHVVNAQNPHLEMIHRNGVAIYFVVHDLLPITMPHYFAPGTAAVHEKWLRTICNFDGVICVSQTIAEEVANRLSSIGQERMRPFRIGWSHNGADLENSASTRGLPNDAEAVLASLTTRPSFLTVGTIEPRKGHALAFAAFEQLWQEGVDANLVIVGKQGWMVEALVEKLRRCPERGKRLFWLEAISDEYLEKVYAASTCLIAASEGEGFGLPLIEAARHKLAIIARDIPVFREVAGPFASYFSGKSPNALAEAVQNWLDSWRTGDVPSSSGMTWLTWAESTKNLVALVTDSEHPRWTCVSPTDCLSQISKEEEGK